MRQPLGCVTWIGLMLFVISLAGCASAPQYKYYTLDMRTSGEATPTAQLDTVKVAVADSLNRPEIMIRTSPTQIEYYAVDRWASGISEQITEKLLAEFGKAPAGAPSLWLEVLVLAFEQVDTASGADVRVKLDVHGGWYNDGRQVSDLHKAFERTEHAASANAAAVVEALSRTVELIAADIAKESAFQAENYKSNQGN